MLESTDPERLRSKEDLRWDVRISLGKVDRTDFVDSKILIFYYLLSPSGPWLFSYQMQVFYILQREMLCPVAVNVFG